MLFINIIPPLYCKNRANFVNGRTCALPHTKMFCEGIRFFKGKYVYLQVRTAVGAPYAIDITIW